MDEFVKPVDMPLADEEMEDLAAFLRSAPDALNIEMLDGFFAALVCSPDLVMPSEYLTYVWGDDQEFESIEDAEKYTNLVLRHWNSVSRKLQENDIYDAVLLEIDGKVTGNGWANGFLLGMEFGGDEWDDYYNDQDEAGVFVPILALAYEGDPDLEMYSGPISDEQRVELLAGIGVCVPLIYKYFASRRSENAPKWNRIETHKREGKKIGRNDPCPCGSGMKYKKCCGRG